MIKFIKDHLNQIVIFMFAYVYVFFIAVVPTNYAVTAPGGLTPLEEVFELDGYEITDDLYSVYVYSYDPITAFQYMILKNDDRYDVTLRNQREKENSMLDSYKQGQLSKKMSYNRALIKAYQMALEVDDRIKIDYEFQGLYVYDFPKRLKKISIGDLIIKINDIAYDQLDAKAFYELIDYQNVTFTILKEDKSIYELNYQQQQDDLPFIFYANYEILDAFPKYQFIGLNSSVGGPSGGMMQTLSLYISLLKLNIDELKISGTGTINLDGSIGKIGGIRQKIYTAIYSDIDLFFVPKSQYNDIKDMKVSFTIIPVETIEEAALLLYENYVR